MGHTPFCMMLQTTETFRLFLDCTRALVGIYCLIRGFTAEYSKSVRKFTAT